MSLRIGPLKIIRDRAQDRVRPSPFRDVAARPTTPSTRGLPPVARGRARRGALRAARWEAAEAHQVPSALDKAIAEEERLERWLEFISRRVEAPEVKSFLHRMALEDRDHGRILRRHRNDLDALPDVEAMRRPPLPGHMEIHSEMGYYRAVLTAIQLKAEAAEAKATCERVEGPASLVAARPRQPRSLLRFPSVFHPLAFDSASFLRLR